MTQVRREIPLRKSHRDHAPTNENELWRSASSSAGERVMTNGVRRTEREEGEEAAKSSDGEQQQRKTGRELCPQPAWRELYF